MAIMRELQAEDSNRRALGKSALQSMMTGKNLTLPRWEVLSAVIRALRAAAAQTELDPDDVGTLAHWKQQLAAAGNDPAPEPSALEFDEQHLFEPPPAPPEPPPREVRFHGQGRWLPLTALEGELTDLTVLAQNEEDPDHAEAAYALAVLALCEEDQEQGKRWLTIAALAQHQQARVLITSRAMKEDARTAAFALASRYMHGGATHLARRFYQAARLEGSRKHWPT
ncbi:hypothetical protein [Actinocorallia aurantiaca]|uniref:hypothetical protein n=1 Tax=Actinocorallia aurantiaca TaxID=46204 RepID=UPI0031E1FE57